MTYQVTIATTFNISAPDEHTAKMQAIKYSRVSDVMNNQDIAIANCVVAPWNDPKNY